MQLNLPSKRYLWTPAVVGIFALLLGALLGATITFSILSSKQLTCPPVQPVVQTVTTAPLLEKPRASTPPPPPPPPPPMPVVEKTKTRSSSPAPLNSAPSTVAEYRQKQLQDILKLSRERMERMARNEARMRPIPVQKDEKMTPIEKLHEDVETFDRNRLNHVERESQIEEKEDQDVPNPVETLELWSRWW